MKKSILFILICPVLAFCVELPNNLTLLDLSIEATQQQHDLQVALREDIVQYERLRDEYLKNPEDKELLFRLATRASFVQDGIKQANLTHLFDAEFLKELNLFCRFAKKK